MTRKEIQARYRAKHRERLNAESRASRAVNPEPRLTAAAKYRNSNRDKLRENGGKYRAENHEKVKAASRKSARECRAKLAPEERSRRDKEKRLKDRHKILLRQRKTHLVKFIKMARLKTLHGCQICRFRAHHCALDFHHRDKTQKKFAITQGLGRNWEKVKAELKKCAILCANCHRRVENGDLECP